MHQEQQNIRAVDLTSIARDWTLQARNKLDERTINSYAKAMASGIEFPPVTLADIDGRLLLVDGFHRYEAAAQAGMTFIRAIVEPMDERQALRTVALANLTHGLPLKAPEKRNAFRLYIKGGGHRDLKTRRLKSYRVIAEEMHGVAQHTTIRNWMLEDFPKIAKAMGSEGGNRAVDLPRIDPEADRERQLREHLRDVRTLAACLTDPETRHSIRDELLAVLRELEKQPMEAPDF